MGKKQRFALVMVLCSAFGVVFGATTSQAAIQQCLSTDNPSNECLMQDPTVKRVESMAMGLFVGAGAAVGATWNIWRSES